MSLSYNFPRVNNAIIRDKGNRSIPQLHADHDSRIRLPNYSFSASIRG